MSSNNVVYKLELSIPGSMDYVMPVRKFVSEILLLNKFSQKFSYRSEVIVDEIISNAVKFGSPTEMAQVEMECLIYNDKFEIIVKDQGGDRENVEKLKKAVEKTKEPFNILNGKTNEFLKALHGGLGLEIVKMLSEEIELNIDDNNVTTLRVVRHKHNDN